MAGPIELAAGYAILYGTLLLVAYVLRSSLIELHIVSLVGAVGFGYLSIGSEFGIVESAVSGFFFTFALCVVVDRAYYHYRRWADETSDVDPERSRQPDRPQRDLTVWWVRYPLWALAASFAFDAAHGIPYSQGSVEWIAIYIALAWLVISGTDYLIGVHSGDEEFMTIGEIYATLIRGLLGR